MTGRSEGYDDLASVRRRCSAIDESFCDESIAQARRGGLMDVEGFGEASDIEITA